MLLVLKGFVVPGAEGRRGGPAETGPCRTDGDIEYAASMPREDGAQLDIHIVSITR